MRLSKIEFTNFRCFRSEVIEFNSYTSLVGPNNCGKSTALRALNIFFGGSSKGGSISPLDFYVNAPPDAKLSLKFEFEGVTGSAAIELSHYVRNERVSFEIVATRDAAGNVDSHCRGIRFGLTEFAPFFAATTAKDQKPIYESIRSDNPGVLAAWQSQPIAIEAVRALEASRSEDHVAIPSEESAYGATGPVPKLKNHLDWIYIPAVKDASTEASEQRESAFSKLIRYAVRSRCDFTAQIEDIKRVASTSLKETLEGAKDALRSVSEDIDTEFRNLTTTPINISIDWAKLEEVALKEPAINSFFKDGDVIGAPEMFGHGLQRTYIIALLSLASKVQKTADGFQLLLGVEEPELYQHPPQARFLAGALADLANGACQVVVTTHSPHFISGRTYESVRVLKRTNNTTNVHTWSLDEQRAYCAARKGTGEIGSAAALSGIDKTLLPPISELFFAARVILVEGQEDVALLECYLRKTERLSDFLRAGCHFVPVGGKQKLPMLIALARGFSIGVFCIFDFDMNLKPEEQRNAEIRQYAADVGDEIDENPNNEFAGNYFYGWLNNIQSSIEQDCEEWAETKNSIAQEWGWTLKKMDKDPMLLSEAMVRILEGGGNLPPLERVCERLEAFWKSQNATN